MWLTKLKIAIIEKNTDNLNSLMDEIPELENPKEIEEALYLLQEATTLVTTLRDNTAASMKQLKKNIDFLKSTQAPQENKLDVKF
jgi:predicted translin family RNA/ssDNA-binding protein